MLLSYCQYYSAIAFLAPYTQNPVRCHSISLHLVGATYPWQWVGQSVWSLIVWDFGDSDCINRACSVFKQPNAAVSQQLLQTNATNTVPFDIVSMHSCNVALLSEQKGNNSKHTHIPRRPCPNPLHATNILFAGALKVFAVAQKEYKAKSTWADCPNYWQIERHTRNTINNGTSGKPFKRKTAWGVTVVLFR